MTIADSIEKISQTVTGGYEKIESGVVGSYQKIERGAVAGFEKLTDKCAAALFAKEGESAKEAKARLAKKAN